MGGDWKWISPLCPGAVIGLDRSYDFERRSGADLSPLSDPLPNSSDLSEPIRIGSRSVPSREI